MEKLGKVKTIFRAFTQQSNIDPIICEKRREMCRICPHNSLNKEKLGTFEEVRKFAIKKPFCTACGCQIEQKTATETEVCGAVYLGEKPRWNRIKLETMNKTDLNLVNLSSDKVNIDLSVDGKYFVMDFGEVDKYAPLSCEVRVEGKEDEYEMYPPHVSCGFCMSVEHKNIDKHTDIVTTKFDLTGETAGVAIAKATFLSYNSSEGVKNTRIEFRFLPK